MILKKSFLAFSLLALSQLHPQLSFAQEDLYYTEDGDLKYNAPTPLDSAVGVGAFYTNHLSEIESGTRNLVKLSFNRLTKFIALDLRVGNGGDYTDMGGTLRLFKHWKFSNSPYKSTGFSLGGGGGIMYTEGIKDLIPSLVGEKKPFMDLQVGPFAQFIWDWGIGVGLSIEAEYLFLFKRQFLDEDTRKLAEDENVVSDDFRQRLHVGLSLMFEV